MDSKKINVKVKNHAKNCDFKCNKKRNVPVEKRYPCRAIKRPYTEYVDKHDQQNKNKLLSPTINKTGSTKKTKQRPVTEMKVILDREFLQKYLNFSDIEDDAFQLAKYMESDDNVKDESQNIDDVNAALSTLPQLTDGEIKLPENFGQTLNLPIEQTPNEINADISSFSSCPLECKNQLMVMECLTNENCNFDDANISSEEGGQDLKNQADENFPGTENSSHNTMSESSSTSCNVTDIYLKADEILFAPQTELNNNQRNETQLVETDGLYDTINKKVVCQLNSPPAFVNIIYPKAASNTTLYTSLTKKAALKRQMMFLFNRTCYKYLNGQFCGNTCKFNHKLPSAHTIFEKLIRSSSDTIMYMYSNFILKSNISFVTYFPTICDIFGSRKMESALLNAIRDCERRDKKQFFKCIYHALVASGLSKLDALSKIIDFGYNNRASYDVFIEIIIEADPLYFIDLLKKYCRYATISSHHMRKLLQQVIDTPLPSILTVFIDILDQYSMYDICDIEMFKFVLLRTKSLVLGDVDLSQRLYAIELRSK